jgi:hypothetical protein
MQRGKEAFLASIRRYKEERGVPAWHPEMQRARKVILHATTGKSTPESAFYTAEAS